MCLLSYSYQCFYAPESLSANLSNFFQIFSYPCQAAYPTCCGIPLILFPMHYLCIYANGIYLQFILFQTYLIHSHFCYVSPAATKYPQLPTFPILLLMINYIYSIYFMCIYIHTYIYIHTCVYVYKT
jgi:hypothetical protein